MQLVSTIAAILLVGLFTIHMSTGIRQVQNDMWQNEALTQVTGIAEEVIEYILHRPFDENTDESKIDPLSYPVITSASQLTAAASFGGCTTLDLVDPTCDDIDDFDGLTFTRSVENIPYTVEVAVQYVNPSDPSEASAAKTVAKEVTLTISTPLIQVGGNDFEIKISRVATYNRHMTAP
jgi:hypothetical protein